MSVAAGQTHSGPVSDDAELRGHVLPYEVVDGWAVHAGDMVLGKADELAAQETGKPDNAGWLRRRDISGSYTTRLWPSGMIPYVIDPGFSEETQLEILAAIEEWNTKTVITLFPRTSEANYVRFRTTTERCRSQVGMVGGEQSIWWVQAGNQCGGLSFLIHEIGHTVGLWHEHQRTDRDNYLTIREEGIPQAGMPWILTKDHPVSGPYDFASVMHYHPFAHSIDGLPVIETIPPGIKIRAISGGLSIGDVYGVAALYGRSPWWTTITTNPPGLQIEVNGRLHRTPALFFWTQAGTRTVSAPPSQIREGSRYVFGRWSDNGDREHELTIRNQGSWYQANYIVQHSVTASPHPAEGGSVTIDPPSPDGYYTLRTPLSVHVQADTANGFKFWKWGRWRMHGLAADPARILVSFPDQFGAHFTKDPLLRIDSTVGPFMLYVDGEARLGPIALHPNEHDGPARVSVPAIQSRPASVYGPSRFRFNGWTDGGPLAREVNVSEGGELVALFQVERSLDSPTSPSSAGSATADQTSQAGDGAFPGDSDFPAGPTPNREWELVPRVGDTEVASGITKIKKDGTRGVGTVFPRVRPTVPGTPRTAAPPPASYTFQVRRGEQQFRVTPLPGATEVTARFESSTPGVKADILAFARREQSWTLGSDGSAPAFEPHYRSGESLGGGSVVISAGTSPPLDPASTYEFRIVPSELSPAVEGQVHVDITTAGGLPAPRVTPRALTFVAPTTADAPAQKVTLTNPGPGILRYRFGNATPWLQAEPRDGVLQPRQSAEIAVRTYSAGIDPDTYHRELVVRFSNEAGQPIGGRAVQIAFAVVSPPDGSLH